MKQAFQRIYPHVQDGRFYNYPNEIPEGFLFRSMYIYLKSYINRMFYHPNSLDWITPATVGERSIEPVMTWIGHSTFLIQVNGINLLTDPIFGDATSLFPRIVRPGIDLAQLPPIDYVIISHNHLDHMDAPALNTIKERNPSCRFLVPLGDKQWFDEREFAHAQEYTWWQQESYGQGDQQISFTFLPAFHWSQRGFFDKNRSLWGSWMIEVAGKKIYFAGDTAYARHFKAIGYEFDHIDCAIMPIGPCEPHKWMKLSHANAHEAYQGFRDLKAAHFVPMHWGAFYFGTDTFEMPLKLLERVWAHYSKHEVLEQQLHLMRIGQSLPLPTQEQLQEIISHIPSYTTAQSTR